MRWVLPLCALVIVLGAGVPGFAQDEAPDPKAKTVLTFYGLLKLEQDPDVSDATKLQEWQAFIQRASEQTVYAKKALERWKNAAKVRLVEGARATDADAQVSALDKVTKWEEVANLYPRSNEGRQAKRRAAHWRRMETKRRVDAAEAIEQSRRPKVERILAWAEVVAWTREGSEARAATRRLNDLQAQLFSEAQSVDRIARVDLRTKLAAWRDVLAAKPNAKQKAQAEARVADLEAQLVQSETSMRAEGARDDGGQ